MAEKQRILIVDDDYNIAELISLYLTKECFETKIVGDGEEALRVFPEFQPNLILLDLMLRASTAIRSAGNCEAPPRYQSSCSPPRAKSLIKCWDWSWALTTT